MILDITAGNRHIWSGYIPKLNDSGPIVFFDIEKNLKIPPDVICDNRFLPIRDKIAEIVIFDPPCWRFGHSIWYGDPKEEKKTMFYGNYVNKNNLRRLLVGGVKTIRRVLKNNGTCLLKWSDSHVPINKVTIFFKHDFEEVYREEAPSKWGKTNNTNYWICFMLSTPISNYNFNSNSIINSNFHGIADIATKHDQEATP